MKEGENRCHDGIGKDLDMSTLALAAIRAGRRERETSFDVMFNLVDRSVIDAQVRRISRAEIKRHTHFRYFRP